MVSSAPNSPGVPSASRSRSDTGANLLQELEALSQALYKASQAQNVISGGPAGPSPRKEQYPYQQQLPAASAGQGLQRRETMPARGTVDVFGKQPSLGMGGVSNSTIQVPGRRTTQVRHSISARPSAPLYEEHEQEELWKQPKHSRHSIAAPSRPLPPPMYGHPEEEEAAAAAAPRGFDRKLQPWHSQGFEKNLPPVSNFPEWLEDNINFSRKLEAAPEKKKSFWNWKPFRTLSHIGHTRYNCLFTLHVHAIEGLPQAMNGLRLTVHWRHKDRAVQTMPSRVFQGSAEFEETLQLRCSVYGSKSAHHAVKFMPKEFTLCVIALDVDELVLGQHRLDLSRLLPEAPDHDHEHEGDDKAMSWTTSFKLAGKAKGGTLVVTFGYELLHREKGDKSGRFGSVIGSPSPSMSSPSLRAFGGGGSHSTHGTPRPRPSDGNDFMSPTLSEPGDYHDYMAMEHLNLDESPHSESSSGIFGENSSSSRSSSSSKGSVGAVKSRYNKSRLEVNSRSGMSLNPNAPEAESYNNNVFNYSQLTEPALAPLTPRQTEEPAADLKTERHQQQAYAADSSSAAHDDLGYGDSYEEDQEFIVVDQGVELGTLPEDIQYPEHRYDEGSVNNNNFQNQVNSPVTTGLEKKFSLDWPAVVADKEENNSVVQFPEFHSLEEIPRSTSSSTDVVRSVTEWQQEAAAQEVEEDRSEDVVDDAAARHWDPLGKFQRIRKEEHPVQEEVVVVDDDHRDRLEEKERGYGNEERELSPRSEGGLRGVVVNHGGSGEFWDPLGKHQQQENNRSAEGEEHEEQAAGVQQTAAAAIWKATPAPPLSFDHEDSDEERDSQVGVEMWSGGLNSSSTAQQPLTEIGAATAHNNQAGIEDLDNEVDLIAGDFLSMLGMDGSERGGLTMGMSSDSENESPRALLLRQFEQEALLEGGVGVRLGDAEISEFNLDEMAERRGVHHSDQAEFSAVHSDGEARRWQSGEDEELASIMEAAESELQKATQTMRSKTRAKMLEDAETEALMQEWGLNERAFENSPPKPTAGFVDIIGNQMVKVPTEPPVLAQGVGPVVQTKDGGMLRSMTPALFSQSNASGKLVMQVSKPVVVPSEIGSSGLDIFRRLASGGVENMALQAMGAMPLEDITGKSVHQISYESKAALEGPTYGQAYLPSNGYDAGSHVLDIGRRHSIGTAISSKTKSRGASRSSSNPVDPSAEFVSLEELAPMAMQKIEALAMDGLKIQSDMTDENAPFSVDALPWPDAGAQEGNKFSRGAGVGSLDGVAAMHLLDSRSFSDDAPVEADGLMSKVISIDEWMRLDAGQYDENDNKDETLAILAAHGVVHKDVLARGSKEDRIRYLQGAKASANFGKGGFMGNTLTIAMLVQLRDPLRNNEPVGAPMMALVQAERVIVPPRPKIPRRSPSLLGNSEVWVEEEETSGLRPEEDPPQPQFKVTAVHVSGLKPSEEPSKDTRNIKKKVWGNQKQQQSGSRWLAANGMGKSSSAGSKLSALKGRHQPEKDTTARPGESLWSISARVHGTGSKWKEVAALNPHIRNPDVILANQKIRTR